MDIHGRVGVYTVGSPKSASSLRPTRRWLELCPVFESDRVDLFPRELPGLHSRRAAGFAEEAIETGRRHDPEKEQFVIGICKTVPRVSRDEDGAPLLDGVSDSIQSEESAAFQNVKSFGSLEVSVNRNARGLRYLLSTQRKIVGACCGADFDEDLAVVAKVYEMLACIRAEHVSVGFCSLCRCDALRKQAIDAKGTCAKQQGSAFDIDGVHGGSSPVQGSWNWDGIATREQGGNTIAQGLRRAHETLSERSSRSRRLPDLPM